ncbi:hypothetical protein GA0115280_10371, partial [Streptomyces sp. Cmuel-A718b]
PRAYPRGGAAPTRIPALADFRPASVEDRVLRQSKTGPCVRVRLIS